MPPVVRFIAFCLKVKCLYYFNKIPPLNGLYGLRLPDVAGILLFPCYFTFTDDLLTFIDTFDTFVELSGIVGNLAVSLYYKTATYCCCQLKKIKRCQI